LGGFLLLACENEEKQSNSKQEIVIEKTDP